MSRMQMSRSARTIGVMATVSAALPLCLTGCAAASAGVQAAELSAAVDSDLLEVPAPRVYDVSSTRLLTPLDAPALQALVDGRIASSGHLVLSDGVITEAEYEVSASGLPEARFVLTDPTVLRRHDSEVGTVTATGTLSVDSSVRAGTDVRIRPLALTEEGAEFEVTLSLPDNPLVDGEEPPFDEISAQIVLVAR
ncbi:MAG: hypothetical protein QM606_03095 [Leucobacter sp.]